MRMVSPTLSGASTTQRTKTIPFQLGRSARLKSNRASWSPEAFVSPDGLHMNDWSSLQNSHSVTHLTEPSKMFELPPAQCPARHRPTRGCCLLGSSPSTNGNKPSGSKLHCRALLPRRQGRRVVESQSLSVSPLHFQVITPPVAVKRSACWSPTR